jgi:UDP-N-acetylmuramoyl-tripeptide--D-alanyl-D-alanine ligase
MPRLSLEDISRAVKGRMQGGTKDPASVFVGSYGFDTRVMEPGALFFALHGERRDGHLFVGDACTRGAAGAVVEVPAGDVPGRFAQIVVPSVLDALQQLAAAVRGRIAIPVVAISGSNGKTTTKEMLALVLETRMRVHRSPGSFNNHIGVPMSILGLEDDHEVLVMELGSNHRGEIAELTKIAAPTIGLITNVGMAHIGHFGSLREVALEKTDLLRCMGDGGRGVVNGDDENLVSALGDVGLEVTRFGTGEGVEYRATGIRTGAASGTTFRVKGAEVRLDAPGIHNAYNALAAVATAGLLGVSPAEAARALEDFQPVRMRTFSSPARTVIDDTYNANPDSVRAAVRLIAGYPAGRRVFVMGEMLELGEGSVRLHHEIGGVIASSDIDVLVGIGGDTRETVEGALAAGMPADSVFFFRDKAEAKASLGQVLKHGDAILVKGSRGAALEEICEYLRQEMVEGRA